MTERELARVVRGALDESVDRLPDHAVRRLTAARTAALAHARIDAHPRLAGEALRAGHRPEAGLVVMPAPRLAWRIAAVVVPLAVVAAGLFGISVLERHQRADDLADLDAAMLTDEVPISAYADRGFGVYLRNATWQAREREE